MSIRPRVREGLRLISSLHGWTGSERLHPYYVCDVFTSCPLQGNQLAVFTDGTCLHPQQMYRIARELNFAETAFLLPAENGGDMRLRAFTRRKELPFGGGSVLGAAFIIGDALGRDTVVLETGAGSVPVVLERDANRRIVFGRMTQPLPSFEQFDRRLDLLAGLRLYASELPIELYRLGRGHVFVALAHDSSVAELEPDMKALATLGVAVSCFAGEDHSWKMRMFDPADGNPEDAATGAAAGPLALHLTRHGKVPFGELISIARVKR